MAKHLETGNLGERLAREYLLERGWPILETNWRCGRAEVDIIAKEGEALVFVEVRARREASVVPEATISGRKMRLLAAAAARYMEQSGHDWEIRFDVITVKLGASGPPEIEHIVDAFFPGG
jgi:putative endonuclease